MIRLHFFLIRLLNSKERPFRDELHDPGLLRHFGILCCGPGYGPIGGLRCGPLFSARNRVTVRKLRALARAPGLCDGAKSTFLHQLLVLSKFATYTNT